MATGWLGSHTHVTLLKKKTFSQFPKEAMGQEYEDIVAQTGSSPACRPCSRVSTRAETFTAPVSRDHVRRVHDRPTSAELSMMTNHTSLGAVGGAKAFLARQNSVAGTYAHASRNLSATHPLSALNADKSVPNPPSGAKDTVALVVSRPAHVDFAL